MHIPKNTFLQLDQFELANMVVFHSKKLTHACSPFLITLKHFMFQMLSKILKAY